MRKNMYIFFAVIFLSAVCLPGTVFSSNIEDQIATLKKHMEEMQKKITDLEAQLGDAQKNAEAAQKRAEEAARQAEERVAEVSGKVRVLDDLTKKFGHIKIGGYVRSRWWDGQNEQHSFDVTEIAFNFRYDVSENISGQFNIWWHPSGNAIGREGYTRYNNWTGPTTFIESAFAEFRNLNIGPIQGKLIVGKTRNWAYGITAAGGPTGRVTSDYSLFDESNAQSRITGIQYLTTYKKKLKMNFAVFNGWSIAGDRARYGARPGGVRYLRTGQMNLDDNNNKAYSMRIAMLPVDGLEMGATFFRSKLSDDDLRGFNAIMGRNPGTRGNFRGNPTDDDEHTRGGLDLAYDKGPFALKAEYFWGEVADVRCNWWYVMVGYKFKKIKTDFYVRYCQANYDQHRVRDITGSGAWDKEQFTPLIIYHLHRRAKLYFEYYVNWEDAPSGAHHRDNNYGFIELILFY